MDRIFKPNPIERWLNQKIYENKYVYLDRWSFVHLLSGIFLGWFFTNYYIVKNTWLVVLSLSIAYEFFEFIFWDVLFKRESFKNIWWDIKLTMVGYFVYILFIY